MQNQNLVFDLKKKKLPFEFVLIIFRIIIAKFCNLSYFKLGTKSIKKAFKFKVLSLDIITRILHCCVHLFVF